MDICDHPPRIQCARSSTALANVHAMSHRKKRNGSMIGIGHKIFYFPAYHHSDINLKAFSSNMNAMQSEKQGSY